MSFKEELRTKTEEIEKLLTTYLPQETGFQKTIVYWQAVRDSGPF